MNKKDKKRRSFMVALLSAVLLVLLAGPAMAEELDDILSGFDMSDAAADDDLSDILDGFEDSGSFRDSGGADETSESPLRLSGGIGTAGAVNLRSHRRSPGTNDRQGLAKLRGEVDLTADLDLGGSWRLRAGGHAFYDAAYALRGREYYTEDTLDVYESETELEEAWIQGTPLPDLDVRIGRQIVVWGKSDTLRVTDVLNPMDRREPGMTDLADLRLPVAMSRLDYRMGAWSLTGIVVHEVRFNKLPAYGSDYDTSASMLPEEKTPCFALDNQEFALAANGVFSGWEASFYAARLFDDAAHVESDSDGTYRRVHARITMVGGAANLARGSWLYKTEAAFLTGLEFAALPGEEKSRLDLLAGVEYYGFSDTTISIEAVNRHLFAFENHMAASPDSAEEDDFQWALGISRDFFHQRLGMLLLIQAYDPLGQGGALERLEFTWDLADAWETTLGTVLYQPGDRVAFDDLDECDRIFFKVRYSF